MAIHKNNLRFWKFIQIFVIVYYELNLLDFKKCLNLNGLLQNCECWEIYNSNYQICKANMMPCVL